MTSSCSTICNICYNENTNIVYLPCTHFLCKVCLDRLQQHKCPFCRINLDHKAKDLPLAIHNTVENDGKYFQVNEERNRQKKYILSNPKNKIIHFKRGFRNLFVLLDEDYIIDTGKIVKRKHISK
jgi:hypothetical protein